MVVRNHPALALCVEHSCSPKQICVLGIPELLGRLQNRVGISFVPFVLR